AFEFFDASLSSCRSGAANPGKPSSGSSSRALPAGLGDFSHRLADSSGSVPTTTLGPGLPPASEAHQRLIAPANLTGSSSPASGSEPPSQGGRACARFVKTISLRLSPRDGGSGSRPRSGW